MTDTTELVARLRDHWDMIQLGEDAYEAADAIERLTRERDEVRAAALEEAAGVADDMGREEQTNTRDVDALMQACAREEMGYEIADAIRALKEPTP